MIRKRVTLDLNSNKLLKNTVDKNENMLNASNFSEKIFKTPEKKITFENSTTTITINNNFYHCKNSFQKDNFPKSQIINFKCEKKINFEGDYKDQKIIKQRNYMSCSPDNDKNLSILTFLQNNNRNTSSKRGQVSSIKISKPKIFVEKKENIFKEESKCSISLFTPLNEEIDKFSNDENYTDTSIDSDICCHYTIPFNRVNDEIYKIKALSKIRKPEISNNKSVNCKFYEYKRRSFDYDGNLSKFLEIHNMKRRKVSSLKKVYSGFGEFLDQEKGNKMIFNFYKDGQIGFTRQWQKKLKISEMDNDIMTDEEQLSLARSYILNETLNGFKKFKSIEKSKK